MNLGWTDDRVEQLKARWADGESASQIARQLTGVTRNAVLGKLSRLGLLGVGLPRTQRPAVRRTAPAPRLPKPKAPEVPERGDELTETATTVQDAAKGTCRWGIGDPREGSFRYCGQAGFPYCPGHAKRAYQPPKPRQEKPRR
jgi:GcrA cell cycle regulator